MDQQQLTSFQITTDLSDALINYLATKPWNEANELINGLRSAYSQQLNQNLIDQASKQELDNKTKEKK